MEDDTCAGTPAIHVRDQNGVLGTAFWSGPGLALLPIGIQSKTDESLFSSPLLSPCHSPFQINKHFKKDGSTIFS